MITLLYNIHQEDDRVTVTAIVEDARVIFPATRFEPEEYGPALCEASFYLDEEEVLPTEDEELIDYLENLNLDWEVISMDDY